MEQRLRLPTNKARGGSTSCLTQEKPAQTDQLFPGHRLARPRPVDSPSGGAAAPSGRLTDTLGAWAHPVAFHSTVRTNRSANARHLLTARPFPHFQLQARAPRALSALGAPAERTALSGQEHVLRTKMAAGRPDRKSPPSASKASLRVRPHSSGPRTRDTDPPPPPLRPPAAAPHEGADTCEAAPTWAAASFGPGVEALSQSRSRKLLLCSGTGSLCLAQAPEVPSHPRYRKCLLGAVPESRLGSSTGSAC